MTTICEDERQQNIERHRAAQDDADPAAALVVF
jgi:hypothetical protein